jgi:hypothetical protein
MKNGKVFGGLLAAALFVAGIVSPAKAVNSSTSSLVTAGAGASYVTAQFTATGGATALWYGHFGGNLYYNVSGTWAGTVVLQVSRDGSNWANVTGFTPITANTSGNVIMPVLGRNGNGPNGANAFYRFFCSAYTSGTIVTVVGDTNNYLKSHPNTFGNSVLDEYDQEINANVPLTLPSLTTAQVQALTPLAVGQLIYNSTLGLPCVSTGTATVQAFSRLTGSTTCQ